MFILSLWEIRLSLHIGRIHIFIYSLNNRYYILKMFFYDVTSISLCDAITVVVRQWHYLSSLYNVYLVLFMQSTDLW